MSSRTGFFDLPVELRLKIYHLACHVDVDCTILQDIEHSMDTRTGIQAILIPNATANLRSCMPWFNLFLTCRTIAQELKSYMDTPIFLSDVCNRTYEMDVDVYSAQQQPAIRQAVWRKLPCLPDSVQSLVINFVTRSGPSPWTEGGPASMARAVYQILNHVCHKGPNFVRRGSLQKHMCIQNLVVNVDVGSMSRPPRLGCNVDPRWDYALLLSGFEQISRMGHLFRYVANIQVRGNGEYAEQAYKVDSCGVQAVPGTWQKYGFSWGVQ